jgi:hypothetical protein
MRIFSNNERGEAPGWLALITKRSAIKNKIDGDGNVLRRGAFATRSHGKGDNEALKIWRYVELAKFVSMLATRTLYFPCAATELTDPYEGWMPRSHIDALTALSRTVLDQTEHMLDAIAAMNPARDRAPLDAIFEDLQRKLNSQRTLRAATAKFGVNCWHINEGESEAMWQLYTAAGQGIAIESTKERLECALKGDGINVDQVRYMDFDRDEIDKGHRHYGLFLKRKAFAHEQELRATILLPEPGVGTAVACDLEGLIAKIHIYPNAPSYYVDAVRYVVGTAKPELKALVMPSRLLDPPDY